MGKEEGVNLGPVEKIPIGQGRCFVVENREIAVFRPRVGGLLATDNRCPHRQGPLCEGVIDDRQVVCPYHGHKFDMRTGAGSESGEAVRAYKAWEEEGCILVEI